MAISLERDIDAFDKTRSPCRVPWAIAGSASPILQACNIIPNDPDILVDDPAGVYRFAELRSIDTPQTCDYDPGEEKWLSSRDLLVSGDGEPDLYGWIWHFSRFYIDEFKVEIAHIFPAEDSFGPGEGIGEATSQIWPYIRKIQFNSNEILVVPLEIQLGTNLNRGLQDRVDEMIRIMKDKGYDAGLLQAGLAEKYHGDVAELMEFF